MERSAEEGITPIFLIRRKCEDRPLIEQKLLSRSSNKFSYEPLACTSPMSAPEDTNLPLLSFDDEVLWLWVKSGILVDGLNNAGDHIPRRKLSKTLRTGSAHFA